MLITPFFFKFLIFFTKKKKNPNFLINFFFFFLILLPLQNPSFLIIPFFFFKFKISVFPTSSCSSYTDLKITALILRNKQFGININFLFSKYQIRIIFSVLTTIAYMFLWTWSNSIKLSKLQLMTRIPISLGLMLVIFFILTSDGVNVRDLEILALGWN